MHRPNCLRGLTEGDDELQKSMCFKPIYMTKKNPKNQEMCVYSSMLLRRDLPGRILETVVASKRPAGSEAVKQEEDLLLLCAGLFYIFSMYI